MCFEQREDYLEVKKKDYLTAWQEIGRPSSQVLEAGQRGRERLQK